MKLTKWQGVIVVCVGIAVIGGLEIFALSRGIDGTMLAGCFTLIGAIIGGALGFTIRKPKA